MITNGAHLRLVNLGCGHRYHQDWINIDIGPQGPGVIKHDFISGIPLTDASCDVVYLAAVFEHIRRADVLDFIRECFRVLKPGGVIRVGVPDLEGLCQLYLSKLNAALSGDTSAAHDYDWILLEMYDQVGREDYGGGMLAYLQQNPMPNEVFVYERIGQDGREMVEDLRASAHEPESQKVFPSRFVRAVLRRTRDLLLRIMAGADSVRALNIGRYRLTGDAHQWMYDRYSLGKLLLAGGFQNPVQQTAASSQIPNWASFNLDTLPDGTVIKPDLIFMEANKPNSKADESRNKL